MGNHSVTGAAQLVHTTSICTVISDTYMNLKCLMAAKVVGGMYQSVLATKPENGVHFQSLPDQPLKQCILHQL